MAKLSNQLLKRKANDLPIAYSRLSINSAGKLEERKSKLDEGIISGYAVMWDSVNDYGERFVKGCFAKSIKERGPNSSSNYKIKFRDRHGKTCALLAVLEEDEVGLYFETKPMDDVQWAKDMLTQVRSGSINNFSIGFKHVWDRIEWDDENDVMINLEANLFEMSGVDIPSDVETYAIRSAQEDNELVPYDVEDFIGNLPRQFQLDARILFTRCMSLNNGAPAEREQRPPKEVTPTEVKGFSADLDFLINKFKN